MTATQKNKPAFTIISGAAAIGVAIASITNRGKKLDKDIQIAALSAMAHHVGAGSGDTTLINRLVTAMPKGSRVNALRDFISVFGAVEYNQDTKVFDHKKGAKFDLDGAMAIMWTEYSPEKKDYKPIGDVMGLVKMLQNKLVKDVTELGAASLVEPELLAALNAITSPIPADDDEIGELSF
jgi:hypothetical protein